jgi:hypothetical protein
MKREEQEKLLSESKTFFKVKVIVKGYTFSKGDLK